MEIKYTIKIKNKHNPPVFDKKLGKGVVATVNVEFKGAKDENLKSPLFIRQLYEQSQEFLNDYFEVTYKKVRKHK